MAMEEVEFRDGTRLVPAHVADLLVKYRTYTMTYEEALAKVNTAMASDYANKAMSKVIGRHFDQQR